MQEAIYVLKIIATLIACMGAIAAFLLVIYAWFVMWSDHHHA